MKTANIILGIFSIIICLSYILVMFFYCFLPIRKLKQRANGKILFMSEGKVIAEIVLVIFNALVDILLAFLSKEIYIWIIFMSSTITLMMWKTIVVRSYNELFVNGRTIQIADLENFVYSEPMITKYLTIYVRNQKPIKIQATRDTERFFNELAYSIRAGYGQG